MRSLPWRTGKTHCLKTNHLEILLENCEMELSEQNQNHFMNQEATIRVLLTVDPGIYVLTRFVFPQDDLLGLGRPLA